MTDSSDTVSLSFPGGSAEFPVIPSVDGAPSIDLSDLTKHTGYTALDHGFVNTASTSSGITYINGDEGILRHRGYSIDDVAQNSTFLEVAWLLIHGELPSQSELEEFDHRIRHHTLLHEDLKRLFECS